MENERSCLLIFHIQFSCIFMNLHNKRTFNLLGRVKRMRKRNMNIHYNRDELPSAIKRLIFFLNFQGKISVVKLLYFQNKM